MQAAENTRMTKPVVVDESAAQQPAANLVERIAKEAIRDGGVPSASHQLAVIDHITEDNQIMVNWADNLCAALAVCAVHDKDVGSRCLLLVDPTLPSPVILGVMQPANHVPAHVDLQATESMKIKCGSTRIELKARGSLDMRGKSISSQAYGPNRIKGASVKLN